MLYIIIYALQLTTVMTIQARLLTVMAAAASASALIVRHKIEK
jgi:hypothetical protein